MLENELDVAILRGDYEWDGPRCMLSQERMCVICAKQYEYTPLTDYPFIERESDPFMLSQIARWMRENRISSQDNRLRVDSLKTCMELAERGLGWALVPEICLEGFRGSVRRCAFDDGVPFVRNTWLLAQKNYIQLRQVDAFSALVKRAHNIKEGGSGA